MNIALPYVKSRRSAATVTKEIESVNHLDEWKFTSDIIVVTLKEVQAMYYFHGKNQMERTTLKSAGL